MKVRNRHNYEVSGVDRATWIAMMSQLAIRAAAHGRQLYFGGPRYQAWTE